MRIARDMRAIAYLILLLLSGCRPPSEQNRVDRKVIQINNKHVSLLPSRYGVRIIGEGFAGHGKLREVQLDYTALDQKHIEGVRELLTRLVESYLKEFNAEESIKAGLLNSPFTHHNLSIIIHFRNLSGGAIYMSEHSEPISYVMMLQGKVLYKAEGRGLGERKTIFEEPYEEALKKVKALEGRAEATSEGSHG